MLVDFGDAPTPYPATLAEDGARHLIVADGPTLGATVSAETDSQPDDDDGVAFLTSLVRTNESATTASLAVSVSGSAGLLDAWIDFNQDGIWDDSPGSAETIASNLALGMGENLLSFQVPAGATAGATYLRLRLSSAGSLSPLDEAADGEVEDYHISLLDGNAVGGAPVQAQLPTGGGACEIINDGGDVVLRQQGGIDLFRAPASALASLGVAGTAAPEAILLDLRADLSGMLQLTLAGGGTDAITVFGSDDVDHIVLKPFAGTINSVHYKVSLTEFGAITVHGGFEDDASLYDGKGVDTAMLAPQSASMTNTVLGVKTIAARSTAGGRDVAWLYDSPGADFFKSSSNYAVLYSALGTYQSTVTGFKIVNLNGRQGGSNLITILVSRTYQLSYSRFTIASDLAFNYTLARAQALYWMKRIALRIDPALGRARSTTELAILLRNHVYQIAMLGSSSDAWTAADAYSRYLSVLTHHEPILCQGLQFLYTDLLNAFGLRARYVSLWAADNINNHATVEVALGGRWVAMDPTYNISLIGQTGRLLSFADIRAGVPYHASLNGMLPKRKRYGKLQIIEGYPISLRTYVYRITYPPLWIGGTGN